MNFFLEFLHKKTPKPGAEIPLYFRRALITSETLLAVYFALTVGLVYWGTRQFMWAPVIALAAALLGIATLRSAPLRGSIAFYSVVTLVWCGWYIYVFGWGSGGQHFLVPLLIISFFNIYDPPWLKIVNFFGLIVFRMILFAYTLNHPPVHELEHGVNIVFQTFNSMTYFVMMASLCIQFSSNLQETERKLRLDNQELHKEAGTDPLTQLPNRRAMMDVIDRFHETTPQETFSVAIADIDFFKKVNDTYGHNCGDYTLRTLAELFREHAGDRYSVCRWGGEEFCFFLPGKNLDEAGDVMMELCSAVRRMKLCFEGVDFQITITIGVEEHDFMSPLKSIMEHADQKLYMGKNSGRDQVVI